MDLDPSSDAAISVRRLSKCYPAYDKPQDRLKQMLWRGRRTYHKEFWALRDVSFDIARGQTVGIIGRNGSGKSTVLQIICGTLAPTSGQVAVDGRVAALLELGAGFNPEFTGRENVYMTAAILGLSGEEIEARYQDIVSFADIGEYIDQPVKTYSSGMVVRLGFAVAAHVLAEILVIDEALAVGDVFFVQKCMRFLREFREQGTLLFVSHDIAAVVNLCDTVVLLEHGAVRAIGSAKEVCELYLASTYDTRPGGSGRTPRPPEVALERSGRTESSSARPASLDDQREGRDQRLDFINSTSLRNDLELFPFLPDARDFGTGEATVTDVCLLDEDGRRLAWVIGGEMVSLVIVARANRTIANPIGGFYIKDRLGQYLFGDNTYLTYLNRSVEVAENRVFSARFTFRMPVLPVGDYSIDVAIGEGSQPDHIIHHWVQDALAFKSHTSSVCQGLVGIPMREIRIDW
jgi:homopolymeric O-antigen transport system ATP-binding protein